MRTVRAVKVFVVRYPLTTMYLLLVLTLLTILSRWKV